MYYQQNKKTHKLAVLDTTCTIKSNHRLAVLDTTCTIESVKSLIYSCALRDRWIVFITRLSTLHF